MAADSKEKVVISATAPRTTFIPVESHPHVTICQCCLLCDNSRPFVNDYPPGPSPWVCDECRETIAFIKDFKTSLVKQPNSEIPCQRLPKVEITPL